MGSAIVAALLCGALGAILTTLLGSKESKREFWRDPATVGVVVGIVAFGVVSRMNTSPVAFASTTTQVTSTDHFNSLVKEVNDKPLVVDFFATWCPPCRETTPHLNQLAEEGHRVAVIDVDLHPELAQRYEIEAIPTLIVFHNGNIVKREMGFHSIEELRTLVGG